MFDYIIIDPGSRDLRRRSAGNSRVLRNVAETMKDYANEVARHPQRVDVGAYLRC